ncbi:hypothetical protein LCGC14_2036190, partial [marine sediment metagenome]
EITKHLGGAAPLVAMEAGGFMDEAENLAIDRDIAEKYAKPYGLGSGAIEYAQQLWLLGRYSKITKVAQDSILRQVLGHIGGSLFEGVEEVSQQGLQNFLMQKAVGDMKERHPDYEGEAPKLTEGLKRSGQIGAGVAFLTGLPGTGMSIANGADTRMRDVRPETKKFLGEPSTQEQAQATEKEPEAIEKAPGTPAKPSEVAPTPEAEGEGVEVISRAAVRIGDRVFEGQTHEEALKAANEALSPKESFNSFVDRIDLQANASTDGFVTNQGRYVSRTEAAEIADKAQQGRNVNFREFDSEDLSQPFSVLEGGKRVTKRGPVHAPIEDVLLFDELQNNAENADFIERSKEIRRELIGKGYEPDFIRAVETNEAEIPLALAQPIPEAARQLLAREKLPRPESGGGRAFFVVEQGTANNIEIEQGEGEDLLGNRAVVVRDENGQAIGTLAFRVKTEGMGPPVPTEELGTLETRLDEDGAALGLVDVWVDPKHRRQGIASQMFEFANTQGFDLDTVEGRSFTEEGEKLFRARMRERQAQPTPERQQALADEDALIEAQRQKETQQVEKINVFKTTDGKKTGITESQVSLKKGVQVETATGKPVVLDAEASRGVLLAETAAKPSEKLPKEPTTLGKDVTGILGGVPAQEAAGLTRAEIQHLAPNQQRALRAAQKRGLRVGFKQGVAETIVDARRTMGALITKRNINEKNKMDLASIVLTFVPKP